MFTKGFTDWNMIEVAVENSEYEYEGLSVFLFTREEAIRYGLRLILAAFGFCRKTRLPHA